eukprot:GHVU01148221.1.p5 GENE.GHVU01148221.1~~GHVU01148221.1.p5  ORF type:complete len:146 (-),score=8.90 GHVU01148221.1:3192-3629(-)
MSDTVGTVDEHYEYSYNYRSNVVPHCAGIGSIDQSNFPLTPGGCGARVSYAKKLMPHMTDESMEPETGLQPWVRWGNNDTVPENFPPPEVHRIILVPIREKLISHNESNTCSGGRAGAFLQSTSTTHNMGGTRMDLDGRTKTKSS